MNRNVKTVQTVWLNGREFRRVRFTGHDIMRDLGIRAVIVTWAVWERKSPTVFRGTCTGRREVNL